MHENHTCIATPSSGPKRQCISKTGRLSQGSSPPEAMSIYIRRRHASIPYPNAVVKSFRGFVIARKPKLHCRVRSPRRTSKLISFHD